MAFEMDWRLVGWSEDGVKLLLLTSFDWLKSLTTGLDLLTGGASGSVGDRVKTRDCWAMSVILRLDGFSVVTLHS